MEIGIRRGHRPATVAWHRILVRAAGAKAVGRDALTSRVRVHAHGSRLPGGGFAAREVEIRPQAPGEPAQPRPK
jgi:hypothetical protein